MNPDNPLQRRRETLVVLVLTLLFGCGAFLFLLLVSGWLVVSALVGLAIVTLLGSLHYLFWGRKMMHQVNGQDAEAEAQVPRMVGQAPSSKGH
jgi:hypothetical protein